MVSAKTNGALLLQVAVFCSGVAARCRAPPACWADDSLNVLLQSEDGAAPFCSDFLGLPASTISATVTPTVIATVTETSHVTETTTTYDETITVTVPYEPLRKRDADVAYPSWLPTTYSASRVSSACSCLNPSLSLTTATATAEAATITASVTVTETTTTTTNDIAVITVTAAPPPITYRAVIEVLRNDTGASQGYIYNSNGPAVTTQASQAATVNFTIPGGVTSAQTVRIYLEGLTQVLAFQGTSYADRVLPLYYGNMALGDPTPPNSPPVAEPNNYQYETDIFTIDTVTRNIGWRWISADGTVPTLALYQRAGRVYVVGDLAKFTYATSNGPGQNIAVTLRYSLISDAAGTSTL